jgi:DnaJ domain
VPAPSFADVLEAALVAARHSAARSATWSASAASDRRDPFLGARPLSVGAAWARVYSHRSLPTSSEPRDAVRTLANAPRRPLTPEEQVALARLLGLGATLTEWFTDEELRREYRKVALRYHPDRHARASELERSRLSDAFRAATDAYRCLRAAGDVRH